MSILNVLEGDIICIPAKKENMPGFVLGRVILNNNYITWLEIFSKFHENFKISREEILQQDLSPQNRLLNPIQAALDFGRSFGKVKWPIIHPDHHYNQSDSKVSEIEFASPDYETTGIFYTSTKELHDPADRRRLLEDGTIYSNPQLIHRINLHLAGIATKDIPWNTETTGKLIRERGIEWWIDGIQYCTNFADAVAIKFKIQK